MERYFIRALKFTLYFYCIMCLVFLLFYFMKGGQVGNLNSFANEVGFYRLIIIGFAFGLAYPFIGFTNKSIYLNKSFDSEKNSIIDIFAQYGYEMISETPTSITFRPSNRVKRIFDLYEDTIEVVHSDNPIIVKGLRKRVVRIALSLENYILNEKR